MSRLIHALVNGKMSAVNAGVIARWTMPKYRVTLKEIVLHELFIEAESESEAREIAWGIDDVQDSTEVQGGGWVEIGEVEEVSQ